MPERADVLALGDRADEPPALPRRQRRIRYSVGLRFGGWAAHRQRPRGWVGTGIVVISTVVPPQVQRARS
ncbi:hypothetical protein ACPA54_30090 [Uniformispora flossi]|uniref:hypothetical protein n=1 Tax=Uniformispora flossi TaxID=3390723 RepID=UPI003C2AC0FC